MIFNKFRKAVKKTQYVEAATLDREETMPVQTLTTQFITTLHTCQPPAGAVAYFDTEIKGFMLEHRASGGGTYYLRFRDAANKVRISRIGRVLDMPLTDARAKAHASRALAAAAPAAAGAGHAAESCGALSLRTHGLAARGRNACAQSLLSIPGPCAGPAFAKKRGRSCGTR